MFRTAAAALLVIAVDGQDAGRVAGRHRAVVDEVRGDDARTGQAAGQRGRAGGQGAVDVAGAGTRVVAVVLDGEAAAGADSQTAGIAERTGAGQSSSVLQGQAAAGGIGGQACQRRGGAAIQDLRAGAIEQQIGGVGRDVGALELEHALAARGLPGAAGERAAREIGETVHGDCAAAVRRDDPLIVNRSAGGRIHHRRESRCRHAR